MITRAGPLAAAAAVVALAAAGDAGRAASMAPVPDLRSATIRLSTVTVAYPARDLTALGPLSLSIDPGELIMLTGSGTGKTTLLHLLLRFTELTAGTARPATSADIRDLVRIEGGQRVFIPFRGPMRIASANVEAALELFPAVRSGFTGIRRRWRRVVSIPALSCPCWRWRAAGHRG